MWSPRLLPWPQDPRTCLTFLAFSPNCPSIPGTLLYMFITIRNCHVSILPLCQWTCKFPSDSPRKHLPIHGTLSCHHSVHEISSGSPPNVAPNPITPSSVCCHTSNIVMITLLCNYWFTDVSTLLITYVHFWGQRVWPIIQSINIWQNIPNHLYFYIPEKQKGSQFSLMFYFSKHNINFLTAQAPFSWSPMHVHRSLGSGGVLGFTSEWPGRKEDYWTVHV